MHRLQIRINNNAEQEAPPTTPPTYIRVRAVLWECGKGQRDTETDRHTDGRGQYTFHLGYVSRQM